MTTVTLKLSPAIFATNVHSDFNRGTDDQILLQGVDWGPLTLSELGSFGDNWIAEYEVVKFDVSALNSAGISVAFYEDDAAGTLYETGVTTSDDGNTMTVVLPGGLAEEGNTSELYLFAEDSGCKNPTR